MKKQIEKIIVNKFVQFIARGIIVSMFILWSIGVWFPNIFESKDSCIEYQSVSVYYENDQLQATQIIGEFDQGTLFICEEK